MTVANVTLGMPPRDAGRGRAAGRAGGLAWLLLLGWPLWSWFGTAPGAGVVVWVLAAVALFAVCWLNIMWRTFSVGKPSTWALIGLPVTAAALLPALGPPWAYVSFVFVVSTLAAALTGAAFAAATAATVVVEVVALVAQGVSFGGIWWVPIAVVAQATAVHSMLRMGILLARLDAARAEVAQLAVENERLRFARDLHDILGHTLTTITIRSQLAARLAHTDPDRAAREMTDVERSARQALDEVRHAVSGYRAPALSEELDKAARGLRLAGIELEVSPADGPIPAAAETLLAWAVREATTNVLRHSRARRCWIDLRVDATAATLEVRDDGSPATGADGGPPAGETQDGLPAVGGTQDGLPGLGRSAGGTQDGPSGLGRSVGGAWDGGQRPGSGLTGLAERLTQAGGRLEVGRPPGGGYRLYARVPLAVTP
ncbi:sensor histidine kinase [Nonomuraea jiangxiensis]|uniref:Two-component system, NarL family, sensor histidine kinase DesK n=1 Tax=Nonomuraea jiangxiensis TaxID=633440 RepID=A0A1G9IEY1_9ACTN|nr:sensor histidine kinase [Nonomuraea jiangxiensis]SDL23800.1 two-component system, NarL family, sensor histidine kinase DesK [Nonomuraea jiangxiensis]